jgi:transketolase
MSESFTELDHRAANVIRGLTLDAVQKANSGHPGLPLGMADAAVTLWTRLLKFDPQAPDWTDRDRFVLSAGHGSMLLYSLLHLTGYDLSLDELKRFRQLHSKTPGHPEVHHASGIETTTGPLGQGIATAVGMAIAERYLAEKFNQPELPLVDHYTYVIASDGDLMEGVSHESCSLAGHLRLGKLVVLYDDNHITIDGSTDLAYTDDVRKRFESYGWHVLHADGQDMQSVFEALQAAQSESTRPSMIITRTTIGYGMPNRQGTQKAHSDAPGEEEVRLAKERLGLPVDQQFYVPDDVAQYMRAAGERGAQRYADWQQVWKRYQQEQPELANTWQTMWSSDLPEGWDADMPTFDVDDPKGVATRVASGKVIEAITKTLPQLLGGAADLTPSVNTKPKAATDIEAESFDGRYLRYGVREHAMAAAMNGMALHGGILPYGGTFFTFSDYMRPALRLSALMQAHVIYVFTHDSIGLGEDGPTHQPVEHLAACRAMPKLTVIRPADATETVEAWRAAVTNSEGPTALILTRQPLPVLDRSELAPAEGLQHGGYVLQDADDPQVILIGTGSEVPLALDAAKLLAEKDVRARVVSLPCWELFEKQDQAYRDQVLPSNIEARVGVEAAVRLGWDRWIGPKGVFVGVGDRYGASAPYKDIFKEYGITAEHVAEEALRLLGRGENVEAEEAGVQEVAGTQPEGHEGSS